MCLDLQWFGVSSRLLSYLHSFSLACGGDQVWSWWLVCYLNGCPVRELGTLSLRETTTRLGPLWAAFLCFWLPGTFTLVCLHLLVLLLW